MLYLTTSVEKVCQLASNSAASNITTRLIPVLEPAVIKRQAVCLTYRLPMNMRRLFLNLFCLLSFHNSQSLPANNL